VDADSAALSFSVLFSVKSLFSLLIERILAIVCILLDLQKPDSPVASKIALHFRPAFAGAGIVVWNQG
jgi:hypothetical protein